MKNLLKKHAVFLGIFILFCLLLFKDPFSERTLIPNFEPYPDALYYIVSARSLLQGYGLLVVRDGMVFAPSLPPLYSLSLVPLFIIHSDPRVFYYTNLILALGSLFIFYQILRRITNKRLVKIFVLFLYVTNYFIYWFPTLAMAENLTLLIFLSSILLLLSGVSTVRIILAACLGIGFYATKYASIPLTVLFLPAYLLKLFWSWKQKRKTGINIIFFVIISVLVFVFLLASDASLKGRSALTPLTDFVNEIHPVKTTLDDPKSTIVTVSSSPWFSFKYVKGNVVHYFNSITGGSERFLWDSTPLVPKFVGIGGILGLCVGLFIKRLRIISSFLAFTLVGSILFISTLYTYDMRYIYTAIPTLLFGFAIFLSVLIEKITKHPLKLAVYFMIVILFLYYGVSNAIRVKSQISLNLRYAETPWYYVSVLKLNEYFTPDKISNGKKPIVISALPPYLVDFFSNKNYTLLPLSYEQEFRRIKEKVWGPNDYSNLPGLYSKYMKEGYNVYVAKYGLGNESYTNRDFRIIMEKFTTELVQEGCYGQCNIYKLTLKDQTNN